MDESSKQRFNLPPSTTGAAVLALAALIGGMAWLRDPLATDRSPAPRLHKALSLGPDAVPARIWQDPFTALSDHLKRWQGDENRRGDKEPGSWKRHDEKITDLFHGNDDDATFLSILGVMAPGGDQPEDLETRRRERQALVSGLASLGFAPEDDGLIGYLQFHDWSPCRNREPSLERPSDESGVQVEQRGSFLRVLARINELSEPGIDLSPPPRTSCPTPRVLPFEWFHHDPFVAPRRAVQPARKVLVLWLDHRHFRDGPLKKVSEYMALTIPRSLREGKIEAALGRIDFNLVGPSDSSALLGVLSESSTKRTGEDRSDLSRAARRLVEIADDYLDLGLPAESRARITQQLEASVSASSDLGEDEPTLHADLKRGRALMVALRQVAQADPGAAWPSTVVARWLSLLGSDEASDEVASLIEAVADYLDTRPGQAELDTLERTTADLSRDTDPEEIARRLGQWGAEFGVKDSDRNWPITMAESWVGGFDPLSPASSPSRWLHRCQSEPPDRKRLECLSENLPPKEGSDAPLEEALRAGIGADFIKSLRELLINLDIDDSDESWHTEVLSRWLDEGLQGLWQERVVEWASAIRERLGVFSGRATAPIPLLRAWQHYNRDGTKTTVRGESLSESFPQLVSTVATDERLAVALIEELKRRGVDVTDRPDHHLVLVSEWDSVYGRALPLVLQAEIQRRRNGDIGLEFSDLVGMMLNGWGKLPERVWRFSYLRGLDGVLPSEGDRQADLRKAGTGARERATEGLSWPGNGNDLAALERASGRSQLDQIRRVGQSIVDLDRRLRREGQGEVRAVGVLGSDFHDKQLVLQVLRSHFPRAIFFTTDLDARYFHPAKQEWNRNLLVASSFGLTLHQDLQRHIPPFRDSYATATFLAGVLAVGGPGALPGGLVGDTHAEYKSNKGKALEEINRGLGPLLEPRLFEISRTGAVDTTPRNMDTALHPPRARTRIPGGQTLWLAVLASVGVMGFASAGVRRAPAATPSRLTAALMGSLLVALLGIAAAGYLDDAEGTGEPFRWLEGVSVWPSEMVRLAAVGLAVAFLLLGERAVARVSQRLSLYFESAEASEPAPQPTTWRGTRDRIKNELVRTVRGLDYRIAPENWAEGGALDPQQVWRDFRRAATPRRRWSRVAYTTLLVGLATLGLMKAGWFGLPNAPSRGPVALLVDSILNVAAGLVIAVLTLWVFDVTRLSLRWVGLLSTGPSHWPETPERRALAERRAVNPDDLEEYLDVRVLAELTQLAGRLLLYPFIAILILIFSRSRYFDAWDWPWSVAIVATFLLGIVVWSSISLRRAATAARRRALRRMSERLSQLLSRETDRESGASSRQFELLIEEVRSIHRGAFGGWATHPGALTVGFIVVALIWELALQ